MSQSTRELRSPKQPERSGVFEVVALLALFRFASREIRVGCGHFFSIALCAALAAPACAQNLLTNPGFTNSLAGWDPFGGFSVTADWSPVDQAGNASSGSLLGTLPSQGSFRNPPYALQCVELLPNRTYEFGAMVLLPTATTPVNSRAYVTVEVYAGGMCSGALFPVTQSPQVMTTGAWIDTRAEFTTGPTAVSAYVLLYVSAPPMTTLQSHFDEVFLVPLDSVLRDGFEG